MNGNRPHIDDNRANKEEEIDVQQMALYGLERVGQVITKLQSKTVWQPEDTASFDCMHYLGDAAIEACAEALQLRSGQHILDIGSGYNATGRFLHRRYNVDVTGIELQTQIHQVSQIITRHTEQSDMVRSLNTDFLTAPEYLIEHQSMDCIVSFLCILHIPAREQLFTKTQQTLKPGGQLYIEDYYAKSPLSSEDNQQLRDVVSCPYLPSKEQYIVDLQQAGFRDIEFEDLSQQWTAFVRNRADAYRIRYDSETNLDTFYKTVADLFERGNLGGARILAHKPTAA